MKVPPPVGDSKDTPSSEKGEENEEDDRFGDVSWGGGVTGSPLADVIVVVRPT